jgi:hypothetical protein
MLGDAAHFDGDGYVELSRDLMPHEASRVEEAIELTLTTTQPNGIILWHGQPPSTPAEGKDYVALLLDRGRVVFS